MKKVILILFALFLVSFCFANGRCEKLKREIMKNPNVSEVLRLGQYDKWNQEIYWADICLKNGGFLALREFDRNLSGDLLGIEYIGKNLDGKIEYEFAGGYIITKNPYHQTAMNDFRCNAISALFNKTITTVNDIIDNYEEIYELAEVLANETPENRSKRRNLIKTQDDSTFIDKIGNFETEEFWGQVFAKRMEEEYNSMFSQ